MSKLCKDCGMDTEPWPPRRGTQEHFIVKDEVWAAAGMPPGKFDPDDCSIRGGGILCVGCIEKRLGRTLTVADFSPITLGMLADSQNTPRLRSRAGADIFATAHAPLPDHIVERWTEAILTNALKDTPIGRGLQEVEISGDEVILVYKREATRYRAGPELKALMAELQQDRIPQDDVGNISLLAWEEELA